MNKIYLRVFIVILVVLNINFVSTGADIESKGGGNWSNPLAWKGGVVPVATDNVIIAKGDIITITDSRTCVNLTLNAGAGSNAAGSLVVSSSGSLTINGNLATEGTISILSSATGTGSLILNGTRSGTGTATVQRYIPSTDFHIISPPVTSSQNMETFAAGNSIDYGTYNLVTSYDFGIYDEANNQWTFPVLTSTTSTQFVTAKGNAIRRIQSSGPGTVSFTGNIYNASPFVSISGNGIGWNCLGKPYTAPLSINSFFTTQNLSNLEPSFQAIYIWNQSLQDYVVNDATTNGFSDIAVGQGFFVLSKFGGGSVSFSPTMTNHVSGNIFKNADIPTRSIQLMVNSDEAKNVAEVKFIPGMTNGLDPSYDIGKFKGNPNISLYTRLLEDNGVDFEIQALPDLSYETLVIPVGLDLPKGGEVTFTLETSNFPVDAQIFLEDTKNQSLTQLNLENAEYTVSVDAETYGPGRFNLVVNQYTKTDAKQIIQNTFNVYAFDKTIYINGPANENTNFELFSIDGKSWFKGLAQNARLNKINGLGFPAGVYILKINKNGALQSSKLVLTEN